MNQSAVGEKTKLTPELWLNMAMAYAMNPRVLLLAGAAYLVWKKFK